MDTDPKDRSAMHIPQAARIGMFGDIGFDEGAGFVGLGRPRLVPAHDVTGSRDAMHVAPRSLAIQGPVLTCKWFEDSACVQVY